MKIVWTFNPAHSGWRFARVPDLLPPGDSPTGLN
jgi:hypothetical protein